MKFYEKSKKSIEYKNKTYSVDFSFNSILDCMEIMEDKLLEDADKLVLLGWRLFKGHVRKKDLENLVDIAFKTITSDKESTGEQAIDLDQDRDYIRAGFRQAYGINLDDQYGRLHWNDFIGLLESLPSTTKMSEIVNIRLQPIPKRDRYNAQQISELMKAKRAVAIKGKNNSDHFRYGLESMFGMLQSKAKKAR